MPYVKFCPLIKVNVSGSVHLFVCKTYTGCHQTVISIIAVQNFSLAEVNVENTRLCKLLLGNLATFPLDKEIAQSPVSWGTGLSLRT